MTDFTQMSDADLMASISAPPTPQAPPQPAWQQHVIGGLQELGKAFGPKAPEDMTDAELMSSITARPPSQPEMRSYEPSLKEKIASFLLGDQPSEQREHFVRSLMGTTGIGQGGSGLIDFTPAAPIFANDEAQRAAAEGNWGKAALSALGAIPAFGPEAKAGIEAATAAREGAPPARIEPTFGPQPQAAAPKAAETVAAPEAAQGSTVGAAQGQPIAPPVDPTKAIAQPSRQELIDASNRLQLPLPDVAATASPSKIRTAGAMTNIPYVGTPVVNASRGMLENIENKVGQVAEGFGIPEGAGESVKDAVRKWKDDISPEIEKDIYSKIPLRDKDELFPLNNLRDVDRMLARQMDRSTGTAGQAARDLIAEALSRKGLPFDGMTGLRTQAGALGRQAGLASSGDKEAFDAVYAGLSKDMRQAALTGGGQEGLNAWRDANDLFKANRKIDQTLTALVGNKINAPEGTVMQRLITLSGRRGGSDVNKVKQIIRALGDSADDVAARIVYEMGRPPSQKGFSPVVFRTNYLKMNPDTAAEWFDRNPALHQKVKDLATYGAGYEKIEKMGNPSGTGRVIALESMLHTAGAMTAAPLTAAVSLAGHAAGRKMAVKFARPIAGVEGSKFYQTVEQAAANLDPHVRDSVIREFNRLGAGRVQTIDLGPGGVGAAAAPRPAAPQPPLPPPQSAPAAPAAPQAAAQAPRDLFEFGASQPMPPNAGRGAFVYQDQNGTAVYRNAYTGAETRVPAAQEAMSPAGSQPSPLQRLAEEAPKVGRSQSAQSVTSFIRQQGGLSDPHGEIAHLFGGEPPSGLVKKNGGMSIDDMRRKLVDSGYLTETPWEGGEAKTTVNDVHDLLKRVAGGERVVPIHQAASDAAMQEARARAPEADAIINEAHNYLRENGLPHDLSPKEERRIVKLVQGGMSVDDAIERAGMEITEKKKK